MFETLVESGSHKDDFARKGSFFLGTFVLYVVLLVAAGVGSIYYYNASIPDPSLELLTLVAPVPMTAQAEPPKPDEAPKPAASKEPTVAMRTEISVVAPVVKSNEVAKETTKEVSRAKSIGVVVGNRDVGDVNAVTATGPIGVIGGGGGGGGTGPAAPVVASDEPPPPPPAPKPTPPPRPRAPVSGGVLNGKAVHLPKPEYPEQAKRVRASGVVAVEVVIDVNGRVIAAKAVGGPGVLREAAERAAMQARFVPALLSGQPVKMTGQISYNFSL